MNYAFPWSVTHSTAEATQVSQAFPIARGVIKKIGVIFPSTADYTTFVKVDYHGQQILPYNRDGYLIGDGETILLPDKIPVDAPPFQIVARGWNTAGSNVTVIIVVTIEPPEPVAGTPPG
jgi:hypothetical protein